MIDLMFIVDMVISVVLLVLAVSICAVLLAGGYAVVLGIKEGLQRSREKSGKDG